MEDRVLLEGGALFIDDVGVEGVLHLAFARAEHAHAHVRGVDVAPALALPGVRLAFGPDDLDGVPALTPDLARPGAMRVERPVLAGARARFVGEPIAAVVADTPYRADGFSCQADPSPRLCDTPASISSRCPA